MLNVELTPGVLVPARLLGRRGPSSFLLMKLPARGRRRNYIEAHYAENLSVEEIAQHLAVNRSQLSINIININSNIA